ncbi:MAG: Ig-like domain-containing protein, partial [Eubacterium sp.]|nr:Ig-like domain-containing protein [Eubacterium sp.]
MKKIGTIMLATFVSCVMVISGIAASGKNVYAADGDEVTVLETDQSEPREGNVFVEVEGKFTSQDIAKAVERINEIREEACREGLAYPNPNNKEQSSTKKLSETDYHALTWSQGMEIWANIRSAEMSIAVGHVRMNSFEEHTYNMPEINGTKPALECGYFGMGFSSGIEDTDTDILNAINCWYEEKDEYIKNAKDSSGDIKYGHYQLMINPEIQCFGIGSFCPDNRHYFMSGIFSRSRGASDPTESIGYDGKYIQLVEMDLTKISSISISGEEKCTVDKEIDLDADALLGAWNKTYKVHDGITWSTSDNSVATIDKNGIVKGIKKGPVTVYAKINDELTASKEITVRSIESLTNLDDITTASGTAPAAFPTKVIANWSDETTSEETVTWDMTKDAETGKTVSSEYYKQRAGGTFTFGGKIEGYEGTVKQKVVVEPAYIVENGITIPEIVTESGVEPTVEDKILPKTLEVKWSNGDTTSEDVSWNVGAIEAQDYSAIRGGEFKLSGTIDENGETKFINTKYKVNPATVEKAYFTSPIETKEMVAPVLPETVKVHWSNHEAAYDTDEQVEWEQVEESKYSKPNKDFTVKGKIWRYKNELEKT